MWAVCTSPRRGLMWFVFLLIIPQKLSGDKSLYNGNHPVCKKQCAGLADSEQYRECMLGCRNYIELSMYRPRTLTHVNNLVEDTPRSLEHRWNGINTLDDDWSQASTADGDKISGGNDVTGGAQMAEEYNEVKRMAPGGLWTPPAKKRRAKFVRIGRTHLFERVGKDSDTSAEPNRGDSRRTLTDEELLDRNNRKVHFVRIGRK